MYLDLRDPFLEAASGLPKEIGRKVWKASRILSRTPQATGLNLEKLRGPADGLWSFRVDDKYRTILCRNERVATLLLPLKDLLTHPYALLPGLEPDRPIERS